MLDKAYEYLNSDRLLHIDMLETLERSIGEVIYAEDDGVALKNGKITYMISAKSEEALDKICDAIGERPRLVVLHQQELEPALQSRYGYSGTMACYQCAYLAKDRLEERVSEGIALSPIPMTELDFVVENYGHISDGKYIASRIEEGMLGAFCGKELAGFIGSHEEGTIGLLHILPEYRRRGLGYSLEAAMINLMLDKGWVPHVHIVTTNEASIQLQEKLGMAFSDKTLTWLYGE